jgi:hypothetical protein
MRLTAGAAGNDRARAFRHVVLLVSLAGGAILVTVLCRSLADLDKEAQSRVVTDHVSDLRRLGFRSHVGVGLRAL